MVRTRYYQQHDADLNLDFPAEGYGGWHVDELPLSVQHTALVVMHSWDAGSPEENPGWFRAVEYLPRSYEIARRTLPRLLDAVRSAGMTVMHVVGGPDYYSHYPGYARAVSMSADESKTESIEPDPVHRELRGFRHRAVFPGAHNVEDINRGKLSLGFLPGTEPLQDEGVAATSEQLFGLCKDAEINHLIYTGFALDGCLLVSPGGMVDMSRRGLLCSTVDEATTAIENKETARKGAAKALALWRVALSFGFVYGVEDLVGALETSRTH